MSEQTAETIRMKSCSKCGECKPLADYHAEWHRNNTPLCPDQSQEIAS